MDEAALAATLAAGRLRGAALDVFEVEPLPQSSPLWSSERLLLTAHNADFTDDYFEQGWLGLGIGLGLGLGLGLRLG